MLHETAKPPPLPTVKPVVELAAALRAAPPVDAPPAAPPVDSPPLAPPVERGLPVWWPIPHRLRDQLGHLLRNWRLEVRARATGFSVSVGLHASIFLILSCILMPSRRDAARGDNAFLVTLDALVPTDSAGGAGTLSVAFALAGLPDQAADSVPAGDPKRPSAITSAEDAVPSPTAEDAPPRENSPEDSPSSSGAETSLAPPPAPPPAPENVASGVASDVSRAIVGYPAPVPSTTNPSNRNPAETNRSKTPAVPDAAHEPARGEGAAVSARRGGFAGRNPGRRGAMLARYGGSATSEQAVALGISWLANHQRPDGSWHFNHLNEHCHDYCGNPGSFASTTAATGLALLPFLGAGHTHMAGDHRETVRRGLFYLGDRMVVGEHGGDLLDGSMYGQGIATIALCEAYAMTHDPELKPFAQSAIDFILHAQDPKGGGWRYMPRQPGDTTVTGWQVMALKSGLLAGLDVPQEPFQLASHFLDTVEQGYGSGYGYQKPGKSATTTSIGVLGRMLTGWHRGRPALVSGVERLAKLGPSHNDMYYNYNATQVMRHFGGGAWDRWNKTMREQLIASQSRAGHAAGSWYRDDEHGNVGGRLYMTAMAAMTLEVYYRHMPLYGDGVSD